MSGRALADVIVVGGATGHGRKRIILAPVTGELMARLILDDDLDPLLTRCLPSRDGAAGRIPETGG